jgi:hypothetical protein
MSTFPALWYTSGTPINVGQRDCAMQRYLEYHAGAHGTGFRKKATAVPLATGSAVHTGLELLGGWILDWQQAHPRERLLTVPDEVVAWAATEAARGYELTARARGLELTKTDIASGDALDTLILEQRTLIEAQVWIYAIVRLPLMLADYALVAVEAEETPVIECTCGLGDWIGHADDHAARNCAGIVMQGRADFLWRRVDDGSIVYEEFKTKATPNYGWEQQWEHSGQLLLNMEAASRRLGIDVSTAFVPVLYKGKRDRVDRDDKFSPKIQQSVLVYGWFDPGNGMTREPEWAARYKWFDEYGKGHTLPRTYKRTPIWDEQYPLRELPNPMGVAIRPEASRVEAWVKGWILPAQWGELVKVLGPFPKQRVRVPDAIKSLLVNEEYWRERVRFLRSVPLYQPGDSQVTDGDVLTVADLIPRSWACTRFDGTPCAFKRICFKDPGWEKIEDLGEYEIRTPHHAPEQQAYEQLGVVFPAGVGDDEGGEE